MTDDLRQQRAEALGGGRPQLVANNGILIGVPDGQQRQQVALAGGLPPGGPVEEPLQFLKGRKPRIPHDLGEQRLGFLHHTLDQRFEQGPLRVEVVVEGPLGYLQLVQYVLNGHPFVALGLHDDPLGRIQDILAPGSVLHLLDDSTHHSARGLNRPSVYYRREYTSGYHARQRFG